MSIGKLNKALAGHQIVCNTLHRRTSLAVYPNWVDRENCYYLIDLDDGFGIPKCTPTWARHCRNDLSIRFVDIDAEIHILGCNIVAAAVDSFGV